MVTVKYAVRVVEKQALQEWLLAPLSRLCALLLM